MRIGVVSVSLWEALPGLLQASREASIPVHLEQATTNEQLKGLADGSLDIGLVTPPFEASSRLRVSVLANEPVVAAAPASIAPGGGSAIPLRAVAERLILFPKTDGPVLHNAILAMFRTHDLAPTLVQESPGMLTTLALVSAGRGASLVPAALARSLSVKGVVFRALEPVEDVPTWPVALAHMPLSARDDPAKLLARWRRGWATG